MKQFVFYAQSRFFLKINHRGRIMTVKFSDLFRNYSSYMTTDESLAEKIRATRWYKEGRIKEEEPREMAEENKKTIEHHSVASTTLNELEERRKRAVASFKANPKLGKKAKEKEKVVIPEPEPEKKDEDVSEDNPVGDQEEVSGDSFTSDDVETMLEAVEFFVSNYGVDKKTIRSESDIKDLCKKFNVQFKNYQL